MPGNSATRKNSTKKQSSSKKVNPELKNAIKESLRAFSAKFRTFNVGQPPSEQAGRAALLALLSKRGGGRTRRRRV